MNILSELDFAARLASFRSRRYEGLREPQARALAGYAAHVNDPDVAVELPTGYGKTLVAFLIADYALERGLTVAYLTGNNQLSDQVLEQARDLPGLDAVKFSSRNYPAAALADYHNAQAVGVMNYWVYFNASPRVEPADLVIFDDAHLAEQPLAGLFAIRIAWRTQAELYEQLCDLVLDNTDAYPSIQLMRDGLAGPGTPPELLAFSHWDALANEAGALLDQELPEETAVFVWPRVRPRLSACGVLIGPTAIEIRPYHPPTQTLIGYRNAQQRLYLSATLGTMDDLQRRLGVAAVVSVLDSPVASGEVGDRVFILNPSDAGPLFEAPLEFVMEQAAKAGRVAWLCASHSEADAVEGLLTLRAMPCYRLRGGGDDGALERWAASSQGHLVTAGRYDGLDFAGDQCRLVVLPSVPAASTEFERFVMAYLGDATFMRHRVGQRVTQALGRANRREEDWAMYLGLAPGFGTLLAQSGVQAAIPADVRPTIDAALRRLDGGWEAAEGDAASFWTNRSSSTEAPVRSGGRVRPGRTRPAATAGSATDEVTAVTRLWLGDATHAAEAAARAAATLSAAGEIEHAAFWRYVQAQAHHQEGTAGALGRTIDAMRAAAEGGAATTWFVRLGRLLADLRGEQAARIDELPWIVWDEWLRESGAAGVSRTVEHCRANVTGSHDEQAEALEILGRIVGVSASRPRGQGVTDVVWSWTSSRRVERRLWEVKTGTSHALPRAWVDQALGQVAADDPQPRRHVVGCIVTHLENVEEEAARAAGDMLCLVHVDAVSALAQQLGDQLLAYADRWGEGSPGERGAAREAVEPEMPSGGWLAGLLSPSRGRLLRSDDVISGLEQGS